MRGPTTRRTAEMCHPTMASISRLETSASTSSATRAGAPDPSITRISTSRPRIPPSRLSSSAARLAQSSQDGPNMPAEPWSGISSPTIRWTVRHPAGRWRAIEASERSLSPVVRARPQRRLRVDNVGLSTRERSADRGRADARAITMRHGRRAHALEPTLDGERRYGRWGERTAARMQALSREMQLYRRSELGRRSRPCASVATVACTSG